MKLYQPEEGYCYNSDSLFLYNFISSLSPKGRVLDVGAGCGIVGLLVARDFSITLEAVEKQAAFVEYAKKNAQANNITYSIFHTDFLEFMPDGKYDYIISNPPFYPSGAQKSGNEMVFQARYDVNLPMDSFFKKVSRLLKPKSHFVFCYDATQFGLVCAALDRVKMRVVDVQFVHPKIDRTASIVLVHARNGSASLMKVREPFISFDGDKPSQKAQQIYKKAKTESIKCQIL
ncbi:MAG: methyltransferase [Epsilonproteobacteria bacterium]|nr:methyltransferase [Campylobacterota bacterium]